MPSDPQWVIRVTLRYGPDSAEVRVNEAGKIEFEFTDL